MTSPMSTKLIGRPMVIACSLDASLRGTGLSAASLPVLPGLERSERPMQASAVAAAAMAGTAHGSAAAANGAGAGTAKVAFAANGPANGLAYGNGQQKTQYGKWAFRGLEPWSDPA
jgi:hypothetical protein